MFCQYLGIFLVAFYLKKVGGHAVFYAALVAEAIVIGLPDADMGAQVHAIVRREAGGQVTAGELLAFAGERLIAYKLPRTVEFTTCAPASTTTRPCSVEAGSTVPSTAGSSSSSTQRLASSMSSILPVSVQ